MTAHDNERRLVLLLQLRAAEDRRLGERVLFAEGLGMDEKDVRCFDVHVDDMASVDLEGASGVIVAGSGYSVFETVPQHEEMKALVLDAEERGIPVLGVCYGAQFLADLHGGTVIRDEDNIEVGTHEMSLAPEASSYRLFEGMPSRFLAQCAHQDRIAVPPEGAIVLASSDRCSVQAFVMPERSVYAVQFHPETTKEHFLHLIEREKTSPYAPGVQYRDIDAGKLAETPEARSLLRAFVSLLK